MSMPTIGQADQTISDAALLQVAKGSVFIFLGIILTKACGFLRQLLVIRMLSPEYYGLFVLAFTIVNFTATVAFLGMYQGAQRFIAYNIGRDDYPKVKGTIQSSIIIATATSVLFMILVMVFSSSLAGFFRKPELNSLLLIMAPTIPLQIVGMMLTAYFLGLHKPAPKVWIEDVGFGLVSVIAIYISLLIARSLYSPAIAILATYILVSLVSIYIFRSRFPLDLSAMQASPVTKKLLYFSLPLFLYAALYIVMGNVDTIVVGHFMNSDQVGFYNAAFLLMSVIPIFFGAVSLIYLPVATSLEAKRAHDESLRLYQSSTRWSFILGLPLFLTLFLFPAQTLSLLFGGRYTVAATALWVLSLGAFINTLLGPNNSALVACGETKMVLYGSVAAAAIDIILCLLLVPRIGILGAAIATASALGVSNITYSFLLFIRHKMQPFEKNYLITIVFMIAFGIALYKPLRLAINRVGWLVLTIYPLFLIVGLLFIVLTRSIPEEDKLLLRLVRDLLRR